MFGDHLVSFSEVNGFIDPLILIRALLFVNSEVAVTVIYLCLPAIL